MEYTVYLGKNCFEIISLKLEKTGKYFQYKKFKVEKGMLKFIFFALSQVK